MGHFGKYKTPSPPKFALPLEGWLVEARIWHRAARRQAPEDVLAAELAFSLGDVRCRAELFRRIEADARADAIFEVLRTTYGLLDKESAAKALDALEGAGLGDEESFRDFMARFEAIVSLAKAHNVCPSERILFIKCSTALRAEETVLRSTLANTKVETLEGLHETILRVFPM